VHEAIELLAHGANDGFTARIAVEISDIGGAFSRAGVYDMVEAWAVDLSFV
jgi:hypothetical protein